MKHSRRDFLKMIAAGGAGALLCSLGVLRVDEEQSRHAPGPVPCDGDESHIAYWDIVEAIARRARERLDEPWEAPAFAQIVRYPHVGVLSSAPCPPAESVLVTGVGRGSVLLWTEPWGLEVNLDGLLP